MLLEYYLRDASFAGAFIGGEYREYTFENCDFTGAQFITRPKNIIFVNCIGTVVFVSGADFVLIEIDGLEPQMIVVVPDGGFYTLG